MPYRRFAYMTSRHQPYEIMLFIAAVSIGLSYFGETPPKSLEQFMPSWFLTYWYISVLVGGVVGLITLVPKRRTRRELNIVLNIERGALLIITSAIFGYICAILATARPIGSAIVASSLIFGWMSAGIVRLVQIQNSIRKLSEDDNAAARVV